MRELGLKARIYEAAAGVGGTWFWNRYPGCRFDSESETYAYSFSKELLQEWDWTEHFSPQPETLRYLNYVAGKFDLRKDITFNARIRSATFDEKAAAWEIETESGARARARFLITALGPLSAPMMPKISGIESFRGTSFHTFNWPADPNGWGGADVGYAGKRVGIIGAGATGVQVIQEIAKTAGRLTVFQRRPNWVDQVAEVADMTLLPKTDSWYTGSNVPGKKRTFLIWAGGNPAYREILANVAAKNYEGFELR